MNPKQSRYNIGICNVTKDFLKEKTFNKIHLHYILTEILTVKDIYERLGIKIVVLKYF